MKLLANGDALTDEPCKICKTEHRLLSDEDRTMMAERGFSADMIDDIARDLEKRYAHLERGTPEYHPKPSATKDAVKERVRRHREKHRHSGE